MNNTVVMDNGQLPSGLPRRDWAEGVPGPQVARFTRWPPRVGGCRGGYLLWLRERQRAERGRKWQSLRFVTGT